MSWIVSLLIWVVGGALAGWIASKLMGSALSLSLCIVVGVVGSIVGGFLAELLGIGGGFVVEALIAIAGACLLLWIIRMVRRA